jgi:hypothetical protein
MYIDIHKTYGEELIRLVNWKHDSGRVLRFSPYSVKNLEKQLLCLEEQGYILRRFIPMTLEESNVLEKFSLSNPAYPLIKVGN